MIGANFVEYGDHKFLDKVFTGKNTDFGEEWYSDIGYTFVITMLFFAFSPILDFCLEYLEQKYHHWYLKKYTYKKIKKNSRNDFLRYLDLHAGPEYSFHSS